jgi:glycosyltransferase involved in cell wall biosynthesis
MIPNNKKIAILHPFLTKKWWAMKMMIYLSQCLSQNNNNIVFYTFSYNDKLFSKTENSFDIKYFKNSKIISFFKIAYSIRKFDYVFIWNSPMHFVWIVSKILFWFKWKIIWWHHHYPWYYSKNANVYTKLKRFIEKVFIWYIDFMIVNSGYLQKSIKNIYNINSKILYPILDKEFLEYNIEKNLPSKEKVLFTCSRWDDGKNIELVFKTYISLKEKIPNLVLKIAWEWLELQNIKNKYKYNYFDTKKYKHKYNLEKDISFLWYVNKQQIIENLKNSNLFLFPSKIDSFWIVVLESMSIWRPVISLNKGWVGEIIKNWVNWFLVESEQEFINKTYSLLTNNELLNKFWTEAKKTATTYNNRYFKENLSKLLTFIQN